MRTNSIVSAFAAVLTLFVGMCIGAIGASAEPDPAAYAKCAAACRECAKACDACNKHCLAMVKGGDKAHLISAKLSADCMEVCNVAAKIVERKGPMSTAICEACAKACDLCAAECKKNVKMAPMAACKKSCDACSAACKKMIGS